MVNFKRLKERIVPPLFISFFTFAAPILSFYGKNEPVTAGGLIDAIAGSRFSWTCACAFLLWGYASLLVPSRRTKGPALENGYQPEYQDNGVQYYLVTLAVYILLHIAYPGLSSRIYAETPELLGTLNALGHAMCLHFYLSSSEGDGLPALFLYYRGREIHPRLLGVDAKQLLICRFSMMGWQLQVLSYFIAATERGNFSFPCFVTLILQTVYIFKFFTWEGGYFHTLDVIMDRMGYYLCWGVVVWVPTLFTFNSYFLVANRPVIGDLTASIILALGLTSILANYLIDKQRQTFRASNGRCTIWGRPAEYIAAEYVDRGTGKVNTSLLLTSGYWGVARHLNYTAEILLNLSWCLTGIGLGFAPFLYLTFLTVLLVHRIFRDEEKCGKKYNKHWPEYCKKVPYRLVPYIF